MELCADDDASDLKEDMDNVTAKYDEVKGQVRSKLCDLEEAFRSVTVEVSSQQFSQYASTMFPFFGKTGL